MCIQTFKKDSLRSFYRESTNLIIVQLKMEALIVTAA